MSFERAKKQGKRKTEYELKAERFARALQKAITLYGETTNAWIDEKIVKIVGEADRYDADSISSLGKKLRQFVALRREIT